MSQETINILFHSKLPHAKMGGQKSLLALIDNMDRTKFKPYLTMPFDGELRNLAEERGMEVLIKPVPPMNIMSFFKLIKVRNEYAKFIKKKNIKLIHTDDDKFAYFSTFIAKKAGIKSIYHARVAQNHKYDKLLEPRIDQLVGISEATIFRYKESTIKSKFIKVFDGLDCELFHSNYNQSEVKNKLEMDEDSTALLFVGQLLVSKGLDDILDATKILSESSKNKYKLYILGTEPKVGLLDYFTNRAKELAIDIDVIFVGQKSNVQEWMQAADIVLFPSHIGEGMGRVTYESMATATPVIATDIVGVNESVTNEVGILINQEDPKAMAEAIELLTNNKELYNKLAIAGRKRALEVFDIKIHAKKMMDLFEEIVEKSK